MPSADLLSFVTQPVKRELFPAFFAEQKMHQRAQKAAVQCPAAPLVYWKEMCIVGRMCSGIPCVQEVFALASPPNYIKPLAFPND